MQTPWRRVEPALESSVRQLMALRWIAIGGQLAAIVVASALGIALPVAAMLAVVAALIALNAWTRWRLRTQHAASHAQIAAFLGFDLGAFAVLLYLSGGTGNPFSLLFILHAVLLALLLPLTWTAIGIAAIIAGFITLSHHHIALVMESGAALTPGLYAIGHWLSFAMTAAVTAWFVLRIVSSLRAHDQSLAEAAQRALRDEAVLRVGTLAAGAAHELSTPLTTMAVTVGEMLRSADTPALRRDATILESQITVCRDTIANLLAAGGHAHSVSGGRERLDAFLEAIADRCRTMHPGAIIVTDWTGLLPAPEIFAEQALRQALLALLSNAVDASPHSVEFHGRKDASIARLTIADRGPGLPAAFMDKLGRSFFTTKRPGDGAGLGLVLARRTLERLGGSISWAAREGGGTCVEVDVPMDTIALGTTP